MRFSQLVCCTFCRRSGKTKILIVPLIVKTKILIVPLHLLAAALFPLFFILKNYLETNPNYT